MKEYRNLNIKGTLIDKEQLERYLEKIASDHVLKNKSDKQTYPIPRIKENFEYITQVYNLLNEHIKLQIPIHPAGEWLLDNYYIIEETVKMIVKSLPLKKYTNFLAISNGTYKGFARAYVVAAEIVAYTDNKIDSKNIELCLNAYQKKKSLNMEEIWNIGLFMQIVLIENIKNICEKIYFSQMQKYRVENIIERLIENKEDLKYKNLYEYKLKVKGYGEMKYPFIEYMSYRLRKYGKASYEYINILEEEVNKIGTSVEEVIKKEHFDIALKKVSMANCIISIKELLKIDFLNIFEKINSVEEILKQDPIDVYNKMDYKTKEYYRNKIKQYSQKTKISEVYIAKKVLELAKINYEEYNNKNINSDDNKEKLKKTHVGYYLIDNGSRKLFNLLINNENNEKNTNNNIKQNINKSVNTNSNFNKTININNKLKYYLGFIWISTFIICLLLSISLYIKTNNIFLSIILFLLFILPIENIIVQTVQYILSKIVKPKIIPKLDMQNGIPEEYTTMVVIPTIIKDSKKVIDLMKKLEVYYLANKSENIYFTLLADCSSGKNKEEPFDKQIIEEGKKQVEILNQKYKDSTFQKFNFIYRKRFWNGQEECYLGWERKRGLLNQFNEYLLGNEKNIFKTNTIHDWLISKNKMQLEKKFKYIITLDADTELTLNTGLDLIGAMAHILNTPILNKKKDLVIDGHAIMQPRVGINLTAARKNLFTKIFAGVGGTDSYTNAISDIYQDNFEEGIFTGKGIYDLNIFSQVLNNEIPENTVLSHDLLEGNYLRCGLVSDIMLMDGYPYNYNSFKQRLHRWIRGDFQISIWMNKYIVNKIEKRKINPLNKLSKYKILDNILREINPITTLILLLYIIILNNIFNIKVWYFILITIISVMISTILNIINTVVYKSNEDVNIVFKKQKNFEPTIKSFFASILRGIISLLILPDKAYISLNAIIKTIYRKHISKKHLLEWTTSEEAEKISATDLKSYYLNMSTNIILGLLGIIYICLVKQDTTSILIFILSVMWLIAPMVMWYISRIIPEYKKINELSKNDKEYLLNIGNKTWQFFKENLNDKTNFLAPDNYQEDRNPIIVLRTSPTNIGLALLSVISSYDLGYENLEDTLKLLNKMLDSIEQLPKWNGHLYNWYNIENKQPLIPRYISTVDSGNFIGYLYVLKQFYNSIKENKYENEKNICIQRINKLINDTDFSILYNIEKRLFSIGFNIEENKLTDSYYDLLASEARQASLVAIAKKDVPVKHWYNLGRKLTQYKKYKGLISWSGTAFEYLMPNINIKNYQGSILDESCKFMIMCQKEYAKKLQVPWGFSETTINVKDLNNNYQYKAVGIPWIGLKRGLEDDIVVSPYGSIMAITQEPKQIINNLKILEKENMYGKYGFYESIDYTPRRLNKNEKNAVVKTYMAHHQGLILLSINNLFNNNILQKRFSNNPEIESIDILLQERMPEIIITTNSQKIKPDKIKYIDYENYAQRIIKKIDGKLNQINVIANENYIVVMDQNGYGYSQYKDIMINRFKQTSDEAQGIFFYLKNIKNNRIWTSNYMKYLEKPEKCEISFSEDINKIIRNDEDIETTTNITIDPENPIEIRELQIKNNGIEDITLEISTALEPILSYKMQDYAHPAFNNLFLVYEYLEDLNIILVKRKPRVENEKEIYMAVNFYTQKECLGELEYEIDKEKFYGRGNLNLPVMIQNSKPFSKKINLVTDPIIAMKRTIKINPQEKVNLALLLSVSESKDEAISKIKQYSNNEKIRRTFELSHAKVEAEARYLEINAKDIVTYQKMLGYLLYQNPLRKLYINKLAFKKYPQQELWKYGISGDLPIMLLKIEDINDVYVLKDLLKAYEFFRAKNIKIDFVILNQEINSYENYVKDAINNEILNKNLAYMQNIKGGIYVLSDIEDPELLEFKANLVIDSKKGTLSRQLKDIEDEYIEKTKDIGYEVEKIINYQDEKSYQPLEFEKLKYYNDYGGFSNDGKEYCIKINKENRTPTVWSHVMANENFGTLVTENHGGFTWHKNSRLNRITSWNNNQITDIPSEIIYMQDEETMKTCSLGLNPMPDDNDYYIVYGLGYAKYIHTSSNITQTLKIFVPEKENVKINILNLKNLEPKKRKIKLIYYLKPVLGEDEIKSNGYIQLEKNSNLNMIIARNMINKDFDNYVYISSSEKINSYTSNKNSFVGNSNLSNPEGLKMVSLNNENTLGENSIIAIEIKIELEAFESRDISIILGEEDNISKCQDMSYKYSKTFNCMYEYNNVKKYWQDLTDKVKINTPLESFNILLNGWIVYQTIVSRLWARTAFYQSGGAFGFRDQLQDTIGLKYIDIQIMKNQIIKHSTHQFIEGDVEHWWHDDTSRGIRTRFTDDLLWLVYLVIEYIEFTMDYSILDIQTPYRKGKILEQGVDEKYDEYQESDIKESIYKHCIKAIEKSLNFGENGLPKIGSGDWNDGFSKVGNKGKGESVWLGFFLYDILTRFTNILENKNKEGIIKQDEEQDTNQIEIINKYKIISEKLKKALNINAWDGRWYKRAFMDNGDVLGTIQNEECRIDGISQSWSVISNAGDNDKKYISMESLENYLLDKENGIIKLLDPPLEKSNLDPGYIKAYLPGTRENGGQYTHGAIWAIIAEAILGFGDKALEMFRMISPIEHSRTKEAAQKYKVEPYVIAADVYGYGNLAGRGGWTWYTGSSSWYYLCGIEYILGLKIKNQILTIQPCIPKNWQEYSIRYKFGESIYNIKIKNPNEKNTGVEKFILNKQEIKEKQIKLINDGSINEIEIIM